jgi:predicted nucleotidyltransferase component of viral defense system
VLARLEEDPNWRTVRRQFPVQILGKLAGVEVGFRQLIRPTPLATQIMQTPAGPLVVPTWEEMICIKAFLTYERNRTRDFVDVAALATCRTEEAAVAALRTLDERYRGMQEASVGLEVAKALTKAAPLDLEGMNLSEYKNLVAKWQEWGQVAQVCQSLGTKLGETLVMR